MKGKERSKGNPKEKVNDAKQRKKGQPKWKSVEDEIEKIKKRIADEVPPSGVLYYKYKKQEGEQDDKEKEKEE